MYTDKERGEEGNVGDLWGVAGRECWRPSKVDSGLIIENVGFTDSKCENRRKWRAEAAKELGRFIAKLLGASQTGRGSYRLLADEGRPEEGSAKEDTALGWKHENGTTECDVERYHQAQQQSLVIHGFA